MSAAASCTRGHRTAHGCVDGATTTRSVSVEGGPRYLVRVRDSAFSGTTMAAMGIEEILTALRSPWQDAYAERVDRVYSPRVPRSHHRRQCARIAPRNRPPLTFDQASAIAHRSCVSLSLSSDALTPGSCAGLRSAIQRTAGVYLTTALRLSVAD